MTDIQALALEWTMLVRRRAQLLADLKSTGARMDVLEQEVLTASSGELYGAQVSYSYQVPEAFRDDMVEAAADMLSNTVVIGLDD